MVQLPKPTLSKGLFGEFIDHVLVQLLEVKRQVPLDLPGKGGIAGTMFPITPCAWSVVVSQSGVG
jgi:hypothetical protein